MTQDFRPTEDELLSAHLDGELSGEERERAEQLLRENAEYQAAYDELRSLRDTLQLLPSHQLDASFAERVVRRAEKTMLQGRQDHPTNEGCDPIPDPGQSWASLGTSVSDRPNPSRRLTYVIAVSAAILLLMLIPPLGRRMQMARFTVPDDLDESTVTPLSGAAERSSGNFADSPHSDALDPTAGKSVTRHDFFEEPAPLGKSGALGGGGNVMRQEAEKIAGEHFAGRDAAGRTVGESSSPAALADQRKGVAGQFGDAFAGDGAQRRETRDDAGELPLDAVVEPKARFASSSSKYRQKLLRQLQQEPQPMAVEQVPVWLVAAAEQTKSDFIVQVDLNATPESDREFDAALSRNRIWYATNAEHETVESAEIETADDEEEVQSQPEPFKPAVPSGNQLGAPELTERRLERVSDGYWAYNSATNVAVTNGPPSPVQIVFVEAPASQVVATLHDLQANQASQATQGLQVQFGLAAEEAQGVVKPQNDAQRLSGVSVPTQGRKELSQSYVNILPDQLADTFSLQSRGDVDTDGLQKRAESVRSRLADAPRPSDAPRTRFLDEDAEAPAGADPKVELNLARPAARRSVDAAQRVSEADAPENSHDVAQEPQADVDSRQEDLAAGEFSPEATRRGVVNEGRYRRYPSQLGRAVRMVIVNQANVDHLDRNVDWSNRSRIVEADSKEMVSRQEPLLRVLFVLRSSTLQQPTVAGAAPQAAAQEPVAGEAESAPSAAAPDK